MDLSRLLSDYAFLHPGWLWMIFPVLIFVLIQPLFIKKAWLASQNSPVNITVVKHTLAVNNLAPHLNLKSSQQVFFTLVCSCLLLLAIAQPVRLGARIIIPATSADLMLIIDTSISMVTRDYQMNGKRVERMTMTQVLLDRFSRRYSGKRIGIIVFGDPAQIILKPSEDKTLVRHLIHRLRPTIAGRQAALGDAVAIAAEYIKSDKQLSETVLVLISDAARPSGKLSPIEGAKRVAEAGAILHTIAIGSTSSDDNNVSTSQMGELIYEATDVKLLQQMAQLTGGESFHGVDIESIDTALEQIEQRHLQQSNEQFSPRKQQSLYAWPLLSALFLLIIKDLLLNRHTKASIL